MRLHTDLIDASHIERAARVAGVEARWTAHGSRQADHAFEVVLEGSGRTGGQWGNAGQAATWDEWGMFLAELYKVDCHMVAGPYKGADPESYEGFHFLTDGRYRDLVPQLQHKQHRWIYVSVIQTYCFVPGRVAAYVEHECKCGARRRRVTSYVGPGRVTIPA